MPIQTIGVPQQYGKGLEEGLSSLLSGLAGSKIQQLQQRQQAKQFQSVLSGLSPDKAHALAALPPELQQLAFKDLLAQPGQQAYAQALAQLGGQQAPQQQQQALQPNISPMESLQLLQGNVPQQMFQQKPQQQFGADQQQEQALPRLNEKQATEIAKLRREEHKQTQKEKQEAFKFNKEFIKEVTEKAKSSRQAINDLDRMEELQNEGKLDTPGYVDLLKKVGLDIPNLMNEGSEEFNKIAQNFLRNAKQYYGGRVSNFEVEQFLKTIPSLSQSPEGRKRVIANLKNISRAELEYNKAVRDIIKENRGAPPYDLQLQVDERVEKQSKRLADLFKKDLAKPVPKGQHKLITAIQSLTGSGLNAVGKAAPALIGGGLGAFFGGPGGALAGGALGELGSRLLR